MRYGSLCSGIEAATVAFKPLGWDAAWFAEIEPFPCAVLAHHYPEVPNHGDMTTLVDRILAGEVEAPDMICGGTPCQAFSVAGLRQSLNDDRGNLTLQFIKICDATDAVRRDAGKEPCWILYENVPGLLNTHDNAFGALLAGLCGGDAPIVAPSGWGRSGVVHGPTRTVAYRVLNAEFFGLAQRRQRVFVLALGGAGRWAAADALLPIIESSQWHPAPRRGKGKGPTDGVAPSLTASGRGVSRAGDSRGQDPLEPVDLAHTLRGEGFDCDGGLIPEVAGTMKANNGGGGWSNSIDHAAGGYMVPVVMAHGQANAEVVSDGSPSLTCNHEAPIVFDPSQSDRFWSKVDKTATCWIWQGAVKDTGYGAFWFNGRVDRAHRVAWELTHGSIPENQCVLHQCDVRTCVNPAHLWLGDRGDNNSDMADKGRAIIPVSYGESHGKAKLTDEQVSEIRASSDKGVELAKRYGISRSTVSSIRLGHTRSKGSSAMCIRMREGKAGGGKGPLVSEDQSLTLATANDQILAFSENQRGEVVEGDVIRAIQCAGGKPGQGYPAARIGTQVRRLTPIETLRLQGFSDTHCHIPTKKWRKIAADEASYLHRHGLHAEERNGQWYTNVAADGPIYKAVGNSWAVNCVRYIALQIERVRYA